MEKTKQGKPPPLSPEVRRRKLRESLSPEEWAKHMRRKANLHILFEREGGKAKLAHRLGCEPSYMSHLVGEWRPFTEKAARDIEKKIGLAHEWMDNENSTTKELTIDAVMYARDALEKTGLALKPDKQHQFVDLAYDLSMALGEPAKDVINRIARIMK